MLGGKKEGPPRGVCPITEEFAREAAMTCEQCHALMIERPEAFVEAVGDFLSRTEAFVISQSRTVVLP